MTDGATTGTKRRRDPQLDELINEVQFLRQMLRPVVWTAWLMLAAAVCGIGAALLSY